MDRKVGRSISVGIATRYMLDGPGARFSAPFQTGRGSHLSSYTMVTGFLLRGEKRQGRGVNHPPHLAQRLKKE